MSQANTISKRNGSGGNRTKRFDRRFNERLSNTERNSFRTSYYHMRNGDKEKQIKQPKEIIRHDYSHLLLDTPSRTKHGDIEMEGFVVECNICCRESDAFGIGDCNHPFCMECVIRLRIIAKINSCPTCRADIDKMIFVNLPENGDWTGFNSQIQKMVEHPDCERYKLQFTSDYLVRCYNSYLVHICLICEKKDERREFKNFASLNQHVYMVHKFEFCNLCTEHLDLLSRERRIYSRLDMDRHIRSGDPDNSSLRGHPKCLFCDKRFFDEEYRYKHLRKEHFFCQICDNTGCNNFFFESHRNLIDHYKKDHIVCEEGECKKLGIAFETELELKIHKSSNHSVGRQVLNLDFHFGLTGSPRGGLSRTSNRVSVVPAFNAAEPSIETLEYQVNSVAPPTAFNMQMRDFPRLKVSSNKTEPNQIEKSSKNTTAETAHSSWIIDDDDKFPPHRMEAIVENDREKVAKDSEVNVYNKTSIEIPEQENKWSSKAKWVKNKHNEFAPDLSYESFPSLSYTINSVTSLPANSVWSQKSKKSSSKKIINSLDDVGISYGIPGIAEIKKEQVKQKKNSPVLKELSISSDEKPSSLSFSQKLAAVVASFNSSLSDQGSSQLKCTNKDLILNNDDSLSAGFPEHSDGKYNSESKMPSRVLDHVLNCEKNSLNDSPENRLLTSACESTIFAKSLPSVLKLGAPPGFDSMATTSNNILGRPPGF